MVYIIENYSKERQECQPLSVSWLLMTRGPLQYEDVFWLV